MASALDFEELTQEVTCPGCHKLYSTPKLLPCLHALCKGCLTTRDGLRDKEGLKYAVDCPVCSETTELPKNGLDSLPDAHFKQRMTRLHSMVSTVEGRGRVQCDQCHNPDSQATTSCSTCGLICQACLENHRVMKALSNHTTIPLKGGKQGSLQSAIEALALADDTSRMKCEKHKEEVLKMYCKTCKRLICSSCVLDNHKPPNHRVDNLASSAQDQRADLQHTVTSAKKTHEVISDEVQATQLAQESLSKQHEVLKNTVEKSFQDIGEELERLKKKCLDDINTQVGSKLAKVSENVEKSSKVSLEATHVMKMAQQALTHTSDLEFLSLKRFMNTRLKEISPKKLPDATTKGTSIELSSSLSSELMQIALTHIKHHLSPSLEASFASGSGVQQAEVDKEARFTVHCLSDMGNPCIEKVMLNVEIIIARSGEKVPIRLFPGSEVGTYDVVYVPKTRGEHLITIQIEGNATSKSPYSVIARGLAEVWRPTLVINHQEWPWGVACSTDREVYVTRNYHHMIAVFNRNGIYLRKVGFKGQSAGNLWHPTGIAVDKDSNIYVADGKENGRLQKFTRKGQLVALYTKLRNPQGVCLNKQGDKVYVCDKGHQAVVVLDTNLTEIRIFGELEHFSQKDGFENITGHLVAPHSVAEAENGTIFISDTHNIHVFTIGGEHLIKIEHPRFAPGGIAINGDLLYAIDMVKNCLLVFRTNGEFVGTKGSHGKAPGQFYSPTCLAVDLDGYLYVADYSNHRVQMF